MKRQRRNQSFSHRQIKSTTHFFPDLLKDSTGIKEVYDETSTFEEMQTGLNEIREILEAIEQKRKENLNKPELSPLGAYLETIKFADKKQEEIDEIINSHSLKALKQAERIDEITSKPISDTDVRDPLATETRQLILSLPEKQREAKLREWMSNDRDHLVERILGTDPELSGLSAEGHKELFSSYREKKYPRELKVQAGLKKAAKIYKDGAYAISLTINDLKTIPEVQAALNEKVA